jgi:hypothetical protein
MGLNDRNSFRDGVLGIFFKGTHVLDPATNFLPPVKPEISKCYEIKNELKIVAAPVNPNPSGYMN